MKNKGGKAGSTAYRGGTVYKKLAPAVEKKESKSNPGTEEKKAPLTDHINENEGFGGWLSSDEGIGTMKMFVMANSVMMLMTMGWPYLYQLLHYLHDSADNTPVKLY